MVWEWAHAVEAYQNAQLNLLDLPTEKLRIIWAEWEALADRSEYEDGFDGAAYDAALANAALMTDEVLADLIWERMEAQARCENGGFLAHCCPYGCGCHMVPFDRVDPATGELRPSLSD